MHKVPARNQPCSADGPDRSAQDLGTAGPHESVAARGRKGGQVTYEADSDSGSSPSSAHAHDVPRDCELVLVLLEHTSSGVTKFKVRSITVTSELPVAQTSASVSPDVTLERPPKPASKMWADPEDLGKARRDLPRSRARPREGRARGGQGHGRARARSSSVLAKLASTDLVSDV